MTRNRHQTGFTIIEMVITIVVGGIIAGIIAQFITRPMEGYVAQTRRAELVDIAETALNHITRDVRQALPNSIRIRDSIGNTNSIACTDAGASCALEIIHTMDGGRYRKKSPGDKLKFSGGDTSFDTLGPLASADGILNKELVIYNTGQLNANAYEGNNRATIDARILAADGISDNITFSPGGAFAIESPEQRFFVVDTPVSYICEGGTITRYHNYSIPAAQPTGEPAGSNKGILANKLTNCSFSYQTGTATRGGMLTASITISDSGESITLLQQVHIMNQP